MVCHSHKSPNVYFFIIIEEQTFFFINSEAKHLSMQVYNHQKRAMQKSENKLKKD